MMIAKDKDNDIAADWDHLHKYSPAPRHRRKMILRLLRDLTFSDCLDAGCAQGYLLQEITQKYPAQGYGCDISPQVIADNQRKMPNHQFMVLDLEKETWPEEKQFDVVVSSEVIEHINDWQRAVQHLTTMTKRYLLITVPGGKLRNIDRKVGHHRHYQGKELLAEIKQYGFTCRMMHHGFPMHSIYKKLINFLLPDKIYATFSGKKSYSRLQKIISQLLFYAFFVNYFFRRGEQIFIIAERNSNNMKTL